jgi:hypothetical protein
VTNRSEYVRTIDAALLLGVSMPRIHQLVRAGELTRYGNDRIALFKTTDLTAYAKKQAATTRPRRRVARPNT